MAAEYSPDKIPGELCDLEEAHGLMELMREVGKIADRARRVERARMIGEWIGPQYVAGNLWAAAQQRELPQVEVKDEREVSVILCGAGVSELTEQERAEIEAAIEFVKAAEESRLHPGYSKLPSMTPGQFLRALIRIGCEVVGGGKHQKIKNPESGLWTTLGMHRRTLRRAIISAYAEELGLTQAQREKLAKHAR